MACFQSLLARRLLLWYILIVCIVVLVLSWDVTEGCRFLLVRSQSQNGVQGFGLFKAAVYDDDGSFLGCVKYPEETINSISGKAFSVARTFGILLAISVTLASALTLFVQCFSKSGKTALWHIMKWSYGFAVACQGLTFFLLSSDICDGVDGRTCSIGPNGVGAVFNGLFLIGMVVACFSSLPPRNPVFRLWNVIPTEYETDKFDTDDDKSEETDPENPKSLRSGLDRIAEEHDDDDNDAYESVSLFGNHSRRSTRSSRSRRSRASSAKSGNDSSKGITSQGSKSSKSSKKEEEEEDVDVDSTIGESKRSSNSGKSKKSSSSSSVSEKSEKSISSETATTGQDIHISASRSVKTARSAKTARSTKTARSAKTDPGPRRNNERPPTPEKKMHKVSNGGVHGELQHGEALADSTSTVSRDAAESRSSKASSRSSKSSRAVPSDDESDQNEDSENEREDDDRAAAHSRKRAGSSVKSSRSSASSSRSTIKAVGTNRTIGIDRAEFLNRLKATTLLQSGGMRIRETMIGDKLEIVDEYPSLSFNGLQIPHDFDGTDIVKVRTEYYPEGRKTIKEELHHDGSRTVSTLIEPLHHDAGIEVGIHE